MRTWWAGLAQRERFLVAIAAALSVIISFWQFMLVPAMSARADAKADLAQADTDLARLQEAYMRQRAQGVAFVSGDTGAVLSGDAFKTAVTNAASDKGLSISRLQGGNENTVGLIFDAADPRLVFIWLEDVETRLGGQATRLTIEQAGNGRVRVNVDVTSGAS